MLVGIDFASIFTIVRLNFRNVLTAYIWNVLFAILLVCIVTTYVSEIVIDVGVVD